MEQQVILYPEELSAEVCGEKVAGKSPTELYVKVMEVLLQRYPELVGRKETHFTSDSVRAGQYTGTTRSVMVGGRTVYIKTGFSTKDKWKGIEKTCQLVGVGFAVREGVACEKGTVETPKASKPISDRKHLTAVYSIAYDRHRVESPTFANGLSKKEVVRMMVEKQLTEERESVGAVSEKTVDFLDYIIQISNKGQEWLHSKAGDDALQTIRKEKKRYVNTGAITSRQRVQDNLGDWKMGEYRTPKGREKLLLEAVPKYHINGVEGISAHTYEQVCRKMIYAKGDAIYVEGYGKICDCHNVIQLLWACGRLFITELVDLTYKGRKEYEFSMGDWGYMSDDYESVLQVRVVNMFGEEELVTRETDSIASVFFVSEADGTIRKWVLMDASHHVWKLTLQNEQYQLSHFVDLADVLRQHQINPYDFTRRYGKLVMFNREVFWIFESLGKYRPIPFAGCMQIDDRKA